MEPDAVPIERIVQLYHDGHSLTQIGEACGITRQAVTQRLMRIGLNPTQRRREAKQARERDAEQRRNKHAVEQARRQRDQAWRLSVLHALADDLGVTLHTLAQFAGKGGPYATNAYRRADQRTRLPQRYSPEGEQLAADIHAIAAPWSPRHLAQYVDRKARDLTPGGSA